MDEETHRQQVVSVADELLCDALAMGLGAAGPACSAHAQGGGGPEQETGGGDAEDAPELAEEVRLVAVVAER